jgi:hypothetical protein
LRFPVKSVEPKMNFLSEPALGLTAAVDLRRSPQLASCAA